MNGIKERVISVSGKKMKSLLLTDTAMLLSSQNFSSVDAFNEGWAKKLSLATKTEIKFNSIKSITKEENEEHYLVKYNGVMNLPSESQISFLSRDEEEAFLRYLEKDQYFERIEQQLSPVKAAMPYIFGLLLTLAFTIFSHYQAVEIEHGTLEYEGTGKSRLYNNLIEKIGVTGVWIIGGLIILFILYKIWQRYSNPPHQVKFLPRNT
jgi:hypothetical protein